MSEPQKKPEKVEPSTGEKPEIKKDETASVTGDITPPPAAANNNEAQATPPEKKSEPVVGVTEGVKAPERNDGKIEPVIAPAAKDEAKPAEEKKPTAQVAGETILPPVPAAEEKSAPPVPPADKPAADTTGATAAPEEKKHHRGFLSKAFNFAASMAAGAAVTAVAKTAAVVGMTVAGAPAWATLVAAGFAVGLGATLYHDLRERHAQKKEGQTLSDYFSVAHGKELVSKKNLKVFGISTVAAMVGSALVLGFHEGVFQNLWDKVWGGPAVQPPVENVVVPPVVVAAPEPLVAPPVETVVAPPPVACLTPMEQFSNLVQGEEVSSRVTDAMTRAASTSPAVAAQGAKDLAFFAFNGFDGVPKNPEVAVELFKQAADAGNLQAKVDLVYMQYHGLGGVAADKAAALSTMNTLPGARAAMFVEAWGGAAKAVPGAVFSTDSILKGMTVGCPTPA